MHIRCDFTRGGEAADADQHGSETDEAVQQCDQLRHLRHFDFARFLDADGGADEHGDDDVAEAFAAVGINSGDERDGHADDAEDVAVFRAFLTGEAGEREDEEDGGDDVGRCDESVGHLLYLDVCGLKVTATSIARAMGDVSRLIGNDRLFVPI